MEHILVKNLNTQKIKYRKEYTPFTIYRIRFVLGPYTTKKIEINLEIAKTMTAKQLPHPPDALLAFSK